MGDIDKKVPDVSALVTTTVLNTKVGEIENKIPDTSNLVTTAVLNKKNWQVDNKISDQAKCITTLEFNKFARPVFDTKVKQAHLATYRMLMLFCNAVTKIKRKKNFKNLIEVIFLVKNLLVMMIFKMCLFFNVHLLRYILNKKMMNARFLFYF